MKKMISPSMMCADIAEIKSTLKTFETCGIEYLHIDIMDGVFVPNFTLGPDYCKSLKKMTNIPLDIHLMVEKPERLLDIFPVGAGDYVAVHVESTPHLQRALAMIKAKGAKAMVAINPATGISALDYVLPDLDGVLVMTVNPGFAGQKLVPQTLEKIKKVREYLDEKGYGHVDIEVDGNVSFENAKKMSAAGANIFVAGTSSVFTGTDMAGNIGKLREAIQ